MRLVNKITDNGQIVGYTVDMDYPELMPMPKNALYSEMILVPLVQAGYKYYSREANDIVDPSGNSITTLPEIPLSNIDIDLWNSGRDIESSEAMSDTEASKYYSYKEDSIVQFRTEDSYEINTREEFLNYLESIRRALYTVSYTVDNRPLGAFVNPQAMFTIDELLSNPDYVKYFDIIVKRHVFRNYTAYKKLINWLCDKGVLNTTEPSTAEFLAAYYAWGPEGVNVKCTNYEVKMNVDGTFTYVDDSLPPTSSLANHVLANRDSRYAIFDDRYNVYSLKLKENYRDIQTYTDLKRARIAIPDDSTIMQMRRSEPTGYKYKLMPALTASKCSTSVSDVSDRVYFTFLSNDGFAYQYKIAHNKIRIGLAHGNQTVYLAESNFSIQSIISNIKLPIIWLSCQQDYYIWNMTITKIISMTKDSVVPTPVQNTSEYLIRDGVNPVGVVDYMACHVDPSYYKSTKGEITKYQMRDYSAGLTNVMIEFLKPIPQYALDAFMLREDDLENGLLSFIELADPDDLIDRRQKMREGEILPGDPLYDDTYIDDTQFRAGFDKRDALDYYSQIKFAYDCIVGGITIGAFGDGQAEDAEVDSIVNMSTIILSAAYAEYGTDYSAMQDFIRHIEDNKLVDISEYIAPRDAAYVGYLIDMANFRKLKCDFDTTLSIAYVSKVFRELSNKPVDQQRPYLLEIISLGNNKYDKDIKKVLRAVVQMAIDAANLSTEPLAAYGVGKDWTLKKCIEASADYCAATLLFYIVAGKFKGKEPVNGMHTLNLPIAGCEDLNIILPANVIDFVMQRFDINEHRRYITLFDLCKREYESNTNGGNFNICLVNADVTPWSVTPKKGFTIGTYSLMPNYYGSEALIKSCGPEYFEAACASKALIGVEQNGNFIQTPIKEGTKQRMLITFDDEIVEMDAANIISTAECPADLYTFLNPRDFESVEAYIKRWTLEKKRAKEQGKILLSIPLKQDIVYKDMAAFLYNEVPVDHPVYVDALSGVNERGFILNAARVPLRYEENAGVYLVTANYYHVEPFNLGDISLESPNIDAILSGDYTPSMNVMVMGNTIFSNAGEDIRFNVTALNQSEIDNLAATNVIVSVGENIYYCKAVNGDFIIKR